MEWMKLNSLKVEMAMLNLWIKQDMFTTSIKAAKVEKEKKSGGSVLKVKRNSFETVKPEQLQKDFTLHNIQMSILIQSQN